MFYCFKRNKRKGMTIPGIYHEGDVVRFNDYCGYIKVMKLDSNKADLENRLKMTNKQCSNLDIENIKLRRENKELKKDLENIRSSTVVVDIKDLMRSVLLL